MTARVTTRVRAAVVEVDLPIRLVSELNDNGRHWSQRRKRFNEQKKATFYVLKNFSGLLKLIAAGDAPIVVTLTRLAPRPLDSHDNLRSGFKGVVDQIAKCLGVDDGSPRFRWVYQQEKSRTYSARVRIERGTV